MANKDGIGKSKKYANNSIHENASGTFIILDRYKKDDDIMLKFEWLSGENTGQVDENKEVNINSSIHKFQVSRGNVTIQDTPKAEPIFDKIGQILDVVKGIPDDRMKLETLLTLLDKQQNTLEALAEQVARLQQDRDALFVKQQQLIEKLIDKIG
ncbi:hypothetical protein ACFVR2_18815 [Gottfriedia sp. NPDC057991]|uniref:hypothetical protein n=1 Tax=Gottfriedia sp. NPDC057991 TaxID=3346298 RepID=UPI0036DD6921